MKKNFEIILQARHNFIKLMDALSLEQINKVPAGYNNNIIWNFAHIIASPQALCYQLAGKPVVLDTVFIEKYKKGTKPEAPVSSEEYAAYKKLAIESIQKLQQDFENNYFDSYKLYTTSFGVELNSVEEAVKFVALHDGLHLGYAMALRKLVV